MANDWSLKGKKITASFDYDKGIVLDDEKFNDISIGPKDSMDLYPIKVIKKLRNKLIEIIKVHIDGEIDYADPDDIIEEINKLFGKDDKLNELKEGLEG